jgi:hypothetical protein
MIPRERICRWLWVGTVACVAFGFLSLVLFPDAAPFLVDSQTAKIIVAVGSSALLLLAVVRVVLFFAIPPRARFITSVALFVMWAITLGVGSWLAIPVSQIEVVRDTLKVTITSEDTKIVSATTVGFGFPTLFGLACLYPRYGERKVGS